MRKEIDELGHLDYDSYKSLVQTLAAFNEGLRLHPSVPKNAWQAVGDDQIPNGPRYVAPLMREQRSSFEVTLTTQGHFSRRVAQYRGGRPSLLE